MIDVVKAVHLAPGIMEMPVSVFFSFGDSWPMSTAMPWRSSHSDDISDLVMKCTLSWSRQALHVKCLAYLL